MQHNHLLIYIFLNFITQICLRIYIFSGMVLLDVSLDIKAFFLTEKCIKLLFNYK